MFTVTIPKLSKHSPTPKTDQINDVIRQVVLHLEALEFDPWRHRLMLVASSKDTLVYNVQEIGCVYCPSVWRT